MKTFLYPIQLASFCLFIMIQSCMVTQPDEAKNNSEALVCQQECNQGLICFRGSCITQTQRSEILKKEKESTDNNTFNTPLTCITSTAAYSFPEVNNSCFGPIQSCGDKGVCAFCLKECIGESYQECLPEHIPSYEAQETSCADGKDNDCDGLSDCSDESCLSYWRCKFPACIIPEGQDQLYETVETSCKDNNDNDCDNKIDCADEDCASNAQCACVDDLTDLPQADDTDSNSKVSNLVDQGTKNRVLLICWIDYSGYQPYCNMLDNNLKTAGAEVTQIFNQPDGSVSQALSSNVYDILVVYDLEAGGLRVPTDETAIANYHQKLPIKNIIIDGRITGDIWQGPNYDGSQSASAPIIQNYYQNLKERGGGILYLTDHDAYSNDLFNQIMSQVGFGPVTGLYAGDLPFDAQNVLMTTPNKISYLWNDSTTGAVPGGLQSDGTNLYTLAWYNNNPDTPAIASTFEGTIGFHVNITNPATEKSSVSEGTNVTFTAVPDGGTAPYIYSWKSHKDGEIGSGETIQKILSVGVHRISVTGTDSLGRTDTDSVIVSVGCVLP